MLRVHGRVRQPKPSLASVRRQVDGGGSMSLRLPPDLSRRGCPDPGDGGAADLRRIAADHDAIEQVLNDLWADPGDDGQLRCRLTMLLTEHYRYVSWCLAGDWTLGTGRRALTIEEDSAEVMVVLGYLQTVDPDSSQFRRTLAELIEAVNWHVDAEESQLFAQTSSLRASQA